MKCGEHYNRTSNRFYKGIQFQPRNAGNLQPRNTFQQGNYPQQTQQPQQITLKSTERLPCHIQAHEINQDNYEGYPPQEEAKLSARIMQHIRGESQLHPADIRKVLAANKSSACTAQNTVTPNKTPQEAVPSNFKAFGHKFYMVNVCKIQYKVSSQTTVLQAALVDRGSDTCMIGEDMKLVETSSRVVDVTGIEDHQVSNLPISTVAGLTKTQKGDVIAIIHQGTYRGKGKTILSVGQLEYFKNKVSDQSVIVGGRQTIFTNDGYSLPLSIRDGLAYFDLRKPTDQE